MPETLSPELLLAATRGPQVETLGDAFARMRANQDAAKARKQQLTLGDISTQEGQLKLAQLRQDAQLDQERRQAMRDIAGGGKPAPMDDVPQQGSPQLAPAPMQAPGMAAPQQAAMSQPAPMAAPKSPFAADEAFIVNRRAAGDFRAADEAEQALLKRKLDSAAAEKDSAQAYNDTQTGNKTASGLRNEALLKGTTFLLSLPPGQRAAAWPQVRDSVAQQGHIDKAHLGTLEYPGDQWLSTEHGTLQDQANIEAVAKEKRESDLAPSQLAKAKTEADQAAKINAGTSATGITAEQKATAKHNDDVLAESKSYHNRTLAEEHRKTSMMYEDVKLTPAAIDKAAEMFANSGQLPQLGMGAAAASNRSAIINRAQKNFPNVDWGANKATFQANQDSLKSLQKNLDNVEAFEKTAGKNLDLFLDTAKKVPDTGSPVLNTPLRMVNDKMLGSPEMVAFHAAGLTAKTEIAKVLNSANAGGVLSDSARKEVEDMIGPNATLKQIFAASNILKQDMTNRHDSYSQQAEAIKSRLTSGTKPQEAPKVEEWIRDSSGRLVKK